MVLMLKNYIPHQTTIPRSFHKDSPILSESNVDFSGLSHEVDATDPTEKAKTEAVLGQG